MYKTLCIYHKIDLDGWMSAAIVKKSFLNNHENCEINDVYVEDDLGTVSTKDSTQYYKSLETGVKESDCDMPVLDMLGWNYGDDLPDLEGYGQIVMCDVSFNNRDMLNTYNCTDGNFVWIDHHQAKIDEVHSYFAISCTNLPKGARTENGLKIAACELTWKYFYPNDECPEIIRLLGAYDSFRHKATDEETKVLEFQYGARASIANYNNAFVYLEDGRFTLNIITRGMSIYAYLCTESKQTYAKGFEINFTYIPVKSFEVNVTHVPVKRAGVVVYKFLCVNQERFNPINFGIDYHKDGYDGFACFWHNGTNWSFSLYNDNGNIDCAAIAKTFGGGGHKGAAGFRIDDINDFINTYKSK